MINTTDSTNGTPPLPANVVSALARGNKVEAIKLLRVARKLDLKSAKDEVDAYVVKHPELARRRSAESSGLGRLLLAVVLAVVAWAIYRGLIK